jgi:HAD superfamily hydrolase (TIGR01509 family)
MSGSHTPDWSHRTTWVFDLDGTLTVPVHDFQYARQVLGISPEQDILGAIATWGPVEQREARQWLHQWELELATRTTLQSDASDLLSQLRATGCKLGILTRNTREVAFRTLAAIGLEGLVDPSCVLGRDCARPKPHPDGVLEVVRRLGGQVSHAVMVGDYLHDVRAGRAAGTATVLVRRKQESGWEGEADLLVDALWPLPVRLPRV